MLVTIAEYAAMNGVSPATIEWLTVPPDARPVSLAYVEVAPVLIAPATFPRLWGAGDMTVRYQVRRGKIRTYDGGRVDIHEGDLAWGLEYWDKVVASLPPEPPRKARSTVASCL